MKKFTIILAICLMVGASGLTANAATVGNTMEIAVGTNVVRTWAQVQTDGYDYGAKQSYDSGTKETHIWMPYGNTDGVYYAIDNVNLSNPSGASRGTASNYNGNSNYTLTLKLHFDIAIKSFRYTDYWAIWDLGDDGSDKIIGGYEYSLDGSSWTNPREYTSPKDVNWGPFINDLGAEGLNTHNLYLRYYTRNGDDPGDTTGGGRYVKHYQVGSPDSGETNFFGRQSDLYVVAVPEPTTVGLLAIGGVLTLLRRRRQVA